MGLIPQAPFAIMTTLKKVIDQIQTNKWHLRPTFLLLESAHGCVLGCMGMLAGASKKTLDDVQFVDCELGSYTDYVKWLSKVYKVPAADLHRLSYINDNASPKSRKRKVVSQLKKMSKEV